MDSLRFSCSRVETRQTECSRQWALAQADVAKETMAVMSQMTEAQEHVAKEVLEIADLRQQLSDLRQAVEQEPKERIDATTDLQQQLGLLRQAVDQEPKARGDIVAEVRRQLEALRQAVELEPSERESVVKEIRQEIKEAVQDRGAVHEEVQQLSSIFQNLCSEFTKLQDKLEGEVLQLGALFQNLTAEFTRVQATSHTRCQKGLSAILDDTNQLRAEITQAFDEHQGDFCKLQELLREHTSKIAEHTAQIREERALRVSSHHETELKFCDMLREIKEALKNQNDGRSVDGLTIPWLGKTGVISNAPAQASSSGAVLSPRTMSTATALNDPLGNSRSTVGSLQVVSRQPTEDTQCSSRAHSPSGPRFTPTEGSCPPGRATVSQSLAHRRSSPIRTSALVGMTKTTPRAQLPGAFQISRWECPAVTPPAPASIIAEGPRVLPLPLDTVMRPALSGVVRQHSVPGRLP